MKRINLLYDEMVCYIDTHARHRYISQDMLDITINVEDLILVAVDDNLSIAVDVAIKRYSGEMAALCTNKGAQT
jgi:hypothetical protein